MGQLTRRLTALAIVALLAAPNLALADSTRRHGNHQSWQGGHHRHQDRHHDRRFVHRAVRTPIVPPFRGYAWAPAPQLAYGCHAVTGIDYYLGRRAQVGGTLCFDAYGQAFILPGSRYVIGYLY